MAVVAGGEECLQGGEHPRVWQGEVVEDVGVGVVDEVEDG